MKLSFNYLILLMFICIVTCSLGFVASEWLLTNKSVYQLNWIDSLELGSLLGGGIGITFWLMFHFNIK